ncbi:MAG: FAD-binding protein, partial [Clostridia bacterium]|nr:FAD-binding protein [Clostridia bacterium]
IHVYEGGGGIGSGGIFVQATWAVAEANGAELQLNTEVKRLIKDADGVVIGVVAAQGDSEIRVKATKGVILCTASIDHNLDMAKRLSPQQYFDLNNSTVMSAVTDTGDGIRMGMEIGADVAGFGGCIDFCAKTGAATDNTIPTFPSFIVNQKGFRFVCEDATYAYHYRAIFQQTVALDGPTYMIFGESTFDDPATVWTAETAAADVEAGVLCKGETIEELAEAIGVPAGNLVKQLTLWNDMAKEGADTQYDRKTGVAPITGPFYAYKNVAANLGSLGGLKINTDTEVIDVNGNVIPHLYAAGLNAGGWIGPYYPGSGTAVMGCVHWGRRAGAVAAKN